MKNFLRIFTILILSSVMAIGLVWLTMKFPLAQSSGEDFEVPAITFSQLTGKENFEKVELWNTIVPENENDMTIVMANYGRLASAFFGIKTETESNKITSQLHISDKKLQVGDIDGVFSWYDPFEKYSLSDVEETFKISQITNGSVYFSREWDGTIVLYSIDMVMDLEFLANGERMTNITMFPGMYVRFHPKFNLTLKDKDFLGVRLALMPEGNSQTNVNTGIGFADVYSASFKFIGSSGQRKGVQGNFVKLLEKVRQYLYQQSKIIDNIKAYSKEQSYSFASEDEANIYNPTKKMYRLLVELQIILSQGVNGEISSGEFSEKIVNILEASAQFSLDNKVRTLLEKFLIDGRFALFMTEWENLSRYQLLYSEVAKILQITPNTGKSQLFQRLANDFSKHFIQADRTIDRYSSIAITLKNTLSQSGIKNQDYFDFALFGFEILLAESDGTTLNGKMVENKSLYDLYDFIIQASQDYVIKDKVNQGQTKLVQSFYNEMFDKLVRTLYNRYTEAVDGKIFIKESFVKNNLPSVILTQDSKWKLPEDSVARLYAKISNIYEDRIKIQYKNEIDDNRISFEKHLARLGGFLEIIKPDKYHEYILSPYLADQKDPMPRYHTWTKMLLRQVIKVEEPKGEVSQNVSENTKIAQEVTYLLDLEKNSLSEKNIKKRKDQGYEVRMNYKGKSIAFIFLPDRGMFGAIQFATIWGTIKITDLYNARQFKNILVSIPSYEARVQKILKENPELRSKNISLFLNDWKIQVWTKIFSLT